MGGYKYRVFLRKRPGLQNGVRLQGVSAYRGCPLGGVRLYCQWNEPIILICKRVCKNINQSEPEGQILTLASEIPWRLRFKSKVTRSFSLLAALQLVFTASRLKKNLWDHRPRIAGLVNGLTGSQGGLVVINHASHLCDPGSTLGPEVVCGLSFSRSQSDSKGFSPGTPVFLPQQNRLPAYSIWLWCCAPRSNMGRVQGPSA